MSRRHRQPLGMIILFGALMVAIALGALKFNSAWQTQNLDPASRVIFICLVIAAVTAAYLHTRKGHQVPGAPKT